MEGITIPFWLFYIMASISVIFVVCVIALIICIGTARKECKDDSIDEFLPFEGYRKPLYKRDKEV